MSDEKPPDQICLSFALLVSLAVERWRLEKETQPTVTPAIRHALRKIQDVIEATEIEAISLDGQPFDPGMAARVVDTINDPSYARPIIDETVSPLVLWRGRVIRPADVVTRGRAS